ncbi:MAG: hypothetical protein ACRCWB_11735 [Enterovibrio sp.]
MKKSDLEMLAKHSVPIFGDVNFRGGCALETPESIAFLQLLKQYDPELREIAFHVRNEGKRSKREGAKHKQEGMLTGAADIAIMCCPPIAIEMKRRDHTKSKLSPEQLRYLAVTRLKGAFSCVALGADAAMEAVKHARNGK